MTGRSSLRLLADTRVIFAESATEWIKTADLIAKLAKFEESPWGDVRGKEITPHHLARLLREFGIQPKHSRLGDDTERGYAAKQFKDAWSRYLPDYPAATGTSGTSGTASTHGVPDVPVVPLTRGYQEEPTTNGAAAAPASSGELTHDCGRCHQSADDADLVIVNGKYEHRNTANCQPIGVSA